MPELVTSGTQRLLQLSFLPGVGASALRKLAAIGKTQGLSELADDEKIIARFRHSSRPGKQNADGWRTIIECCNEQDIRIISAFDEDYPAPLLHIEDFPPILYVKGSVASLRKIGCAVVGTREPSRLG